MKVLIAGSSTNNNERLIKDKYCLENVEIIAGPKEGKDVTEAVYELEPDILVLNTRVSRRTGIEVLEEIRQKNSYPIVIILADETRPQQRRAYIEAGAHFFFNESTETHKIGEVLSRFIQGNNLLKDICLFESWDNPETVLRQQ